MVSIYLVFSIALLYLWVHSNGRTLATFYDFLVANYEKAFAMARERNIGSLAVGYKTCA